ncbi:hypothetical protein PIB30_115883, partial [Stylosanthes scabra]|nr:hypothetical protein [Stylosanthes scabra]
MRGSSFWPCKLSYSFSTPILVVPGACMMILASHAYAWASTPMRGSVELRMDDFSMSHAWLLAARIPSTHMRGSSTPM